MDPVSTIIEVEGARLHVQERGQPDGVELLFLHGGAGSLHDWDGLIAAFGDCRCVLLDTRGHGASTMDGTALNYPLLARDAEAVISETRLVSPVIIGHSDGGITAIHVAARGAVPLAGLVTIAVHSDPPRPDIMRDIYDRLTAERWRSRFPDMVQRYERLNPEPDFDRLFGALVGMWRNDGPGNYPGPLARAVRCPALVIGGDDDHLVPRDDTLALARAVDGARLGIIPFGSHVPHWDHPDRVIPYIRQFLEELNQRPG